MTQIDIDLTRETFVLTLEGGRAVHFPRTSHGVAKLWAVLFARKLDAQRTLGTPPAPLQDQVDKMVAHFQAERDAKAKAEAQDLLDLLGEFDL